MKRVIIIRYSEIYLKGKNRGFFERAFEVNMRRALKGVDCLLTRQSGRYLVENFDEEQTEEIVERLKKVFGLHTLSVAYETDADMDSIFGAAVLVCKPSGTFKVQAHRGNKKYPLTSVDISRQLGGRLLSYNKNLKVDVHTPDFYVNIDVREYNIRKR